LLGCLNVVGTSALLLGCSECLIWSAISLFMGLPCGIFACIASLSMMGATDAATYNTSKTTAMYFNIGASAVGIIWIIVIGVVIAGADSNTTDLCVDEPCDDDALWSYND
jgi:hypothetical protein